uniref:Uncharacterized protein n=1 Tax=Cacopsylla melanoneura TaxID=428564 RepID=A0A8D8U383_9HEMI
MLLTLLQLKIERFSFSNYKACDKVSIKGTSMKIQSYIGYNNMSNRKYRYERILLTFFVQRKGTETPAVMSGDLGYSKTTTVIVRPYLGQTQVCKVHLYNHKDKIEYS